LRRCDKRGCRQLRVCSCWRGSGLQRQGQSQPASASQRQPAPASVSQRQPASASGGRLSVRNRKKRAKIRAEAAEPPKTPGSLFALSLQLQLTDGRRRGSPQSANHCIASWGALAQHTRARGASRNFLAAQVQKFFFFSNTGRPSVGDSPFKAIRTAASPDTATQSFNLSDLA
jgi:hypothetical protein